MTTIIIIIQHLTKYFGCYLPLLNVVLPLHGIPYWAVDIVCPAVRLFHKMLPKLRFLVKNPQNSQSASQSVCRSVVRRANLWREISINTSGYFEIHKLYRTSSIKCVSDETFTCPSQVHFLEPRFRGEGDEWESELNIYQVGLNAF